ncbi:Hypothetical predicted protein [Paramuricea clavata]|uniref:Uncharacterized protein n=1 Tax=Paramuricea clavata TaxID=317549 RepID=A0A7D9L1S7_PARCT|nr:Hypothetical predicted protein [Paramuricea clavata]
MALYADDSKLYRTIKSDADTENLQLDLNEMNSWTETWRMKFNTNKCKVMRLSRKKIQSHVSDYILGHESLELVKTIKDLGITVSDDVRWGKHIAEITAKANRTLGLIKRTCRDFEDQTVRKLLYLTLMVRPQLEFCSAAAGIFIRVVVPVRSKIPAYVGCGATTSYKVYFKLP